jgi:hypothetical protein
MVEKHLALAAASLLSALGLLSCTATISGENGDDVAMAGSAAASSGGGTTGGGNVGVSGSGIPSPEPDPTCETTGDPGPAPLRLLSRVQYLNTLRGLVGDVQGVEAALGPSRETSEFGLLQADIAQVDVENYQAAADLVATKLTESDSALKRVAPCEATSATELRACARDFVQGFGERAYRAPLLDDVDIERHLALYDQGAKTSHRHGMELLLKGVLQAPRFLYRVEIGTEEAVGEKAIRLSAREVAARLSYGLWDAAPDQRLLDAADAGLLANPDGVVEQAQWMLLDERGQTLVRRFLERFIHVSETDTLIKNGDLYPEWGDGKFRRAVQDQARTFFDYVLNERGGKLNALLTSPTLFVNEPLGSFYGVTGGADFAPIERRDGTASGLLTLPALLSRLAKPAESSVIYRGKFVREALFCQQLPAPPANIPRPPEVDADSSTRERLAQHEVDPSCSSCHRLIDPIGFGFENFDAIGRYRTQDGGQAVDARGEIVGIADAGGQFDGVVELGQRLAQSATVQECVARQWFRFFMARFEQDADRCSMQRVVQAFRGAESALTALPEAVLRTDAFLYRRPLNQVEP